MLNPKLLIRSILPPVLMSCISRIWHKLRGMGFYTFEGAYSSLDSVPCGPDAYNTKKLVEKINQDRITSYLKSNPDLPLDDHRGSVLLPLLTAVYFAKVRRNDLTIVDFGAGFGIALKSITNYAKNTCNAKISYVIVETAEMVASINSNMDLLRSKIPECFSVEAVESLSEINLPHIDIINIASAIQYLKSYKKIITNVINLRPDLILVSDTPMCVGGG